MCECQGCKKDFKVFGSNLTSGQSKSCKKCAKRERKTKERQPKLNGYDLKVHHYDYRIIEANIRMFEVPLKDLFTAWRIKSRAGAQCAINDMIKIFKRFEQRRKENV